MLPLLLAALLGQAGAAAEAPPPQGSEWQGLPGEQQASPAPQAPATAPAPAPAPDRPLPMPPTIEEPMYPPSQLPLARPPESPNRISLYGAAPLGSWQRAAAVSLGFPLLQARALMGVTSKLDLGVEYDTLYGLMHDVRASGRFTLWTGETMSLGVVGDGGPAFFSKTPQQDAKGARWLTGRRNFNASAGAVLSVHGPAPRASRFFLSARCQLAMDTEPIQGEPLGGTPPPVQVTPNLLTEVGLEAPVSEWVSLAFRVGLDLHGRPEDSLVMVTGSAGVVTALP
jgi:hypothetical protein